MSLSIVGTRQRLPTENDSPPTRPVTQWHSQGWFTNSACARGRPRVQHSRDQVTHPPSVSIAISWLIVPPTGVSSHFGALLPPIRCQQPQPFCKPQTYSVFMLGRLLLLPHRISLWLLCMWLSFKMFAESLEYLYQAPEKSRMLPRNFQQANEIYHCTWNHEVCLEITGSCFLSCCQKVTCSLIKANVLAPIQVPSSVQMTKKQIEVLYKSKRRKGWSLIQEVI